MASTNRAKSHMIGRRCIIKAMDLRSSPFGFPVEYPFEIIDAFEDEYLIAGPWTNDVLWMVKKSAVHVKL